MTKLLISFYQTGRYFEGLIPVLEKMKLYYDDVHLLCTSELCDNPAWISLQKSYQATPCLTLVTHFVDHYQERERNHARHLHQLTLQTYDAHYFLPYLENDSPDGTSLCYQAYCCAERKTDGKSGRLLIGFPHGIGDFIAFTPSLRYLSQYYKTIDLCCKSDLIASKILTHCPYIATTYPLLENSWGLDGFKPLAQNQLRYLELLDTIKYDQQYYLPNTWFDKKIQQYVLATNLLSRGFNSEAAHAWDVEVWPDLSDNNSLVNRYKKSSPYAFVHHYRPSNGYEFSIENLPELQNFQGTLFDTLTNTFDDLNEAFICLAHADRCIVMDSVFMWAAFALKKSIDFLYFIDLEDPRRDLTCLPIPAHHQFVKRCNVAF